MLTRFRPARRISRTLRSSIGVALALGATLVLSCAPVGATGCPITSAGSCSDGSQVLTLNVLPAAFLSVTAPASFSLAGQVSGTTSAAEPLGSMGFADTLNDSTAWGISLAATDFGAGAVPFTGMTIGVTSATDYIGHAGNAGTPVAGSASQTLAGSDTVPGTTYSTPIALIASTAAAVQGSWTTPADATGNTITVAIPPATVAGAYTATLQYTISG